ncbi:MAG TPA: tRNA (guanosine(37)-N1)-methyltransferase TrmD, partial [Deinococcus radiodurans]|nr:tRNA (guanosine(37)-N1)-methyltransferase TrmD [Deinococcus radiodurans]
RDQALERTLRRRPDLLPGAGLTPQDSAALLALGVTPEQLSIWDAPPPPAPKVRRKKKPSAEDKAPTDTSSE